MRNSVKLGFVSLSALSLGIAIVVPGSSAQTAAAQSQQPLCRRPAALPALPPEPRVND